MKISTEERFWSKVRSTLPGECWLWIASVDRDGYGKFGKPEGGWVRAHRWAYEHLVAPIPDGLVAEALRDGLHKTRLGEDAGFHSVWHGNKLDGTELVLVVFNDAAALSVTVETLAQS